MAKVTLILEDHVDENGQEGLIIDYDTGSDHDENSLAHQYASSFVSHIMEQADKASIEDKDTGTVTPVNKDKETSGLN